VKRRALIPVVAIAAAALFVRLGVWQLDRLAERRAANALVQARRAMAVIQLSSLGVEEREIAIEPHRKAMVSGRFDFSREIVLVGRSDRGVPGVHVVTPLVFGGDRAVLVERGWVPSPDARSVPLARLRESDSTRVEGVLLPPPARPSGTRAREFPLELQTAAPDSLQAHYPYRLFPLVLRRAVRPSSMPAAMRMIPLAPLDEGPHLSYAIQWFAFAVIALVGGGVLYWREGGRGKGEGRA
jgi:surfeit locus 1 family protein